MNVEVVDWGEVVEVKSDIEADDMYSISIIFLGGEVMTYGYMDIKKWIKDYNYLLDKFNRRL